MGGDAHADTATVKPDIDQRLQMEWLLADGPSFVIESAMRLPDGGLALLLGSVEDQDSREIYVRVRDESDVLYSTDDDDAVVMSRVDAEGPWVDGKPIEVPSMHDTPVKPA